LDLNRVGVNDITFAGYDVPHPLRNEMVIRIGCPEEAGARRVLREAMVACGAMFASWKESWKAKGAGPVQGPSGVNKPRVLRPIQKPKLKA
jgi:hypothetical protein